MKLSLSTGSNTAECPVSASDLAAAGDRLGIEVDQIEYDIYEVNDTGGYQTSHWLRFLSPLQISITDAPPNARTVKPPPAAKLLSQKVLEVTKANGWVYEAEFEVPVLADGVCDIGFSTGTDVQRKHHSFLNALSEYAVMAGQVDSMILQMAAPPRHGSRISDMLANLAEVAIGVAGGLRDFRKFCASEKAISLYAIKLQFGRGLALTSPAVEGVAAEWKPGWPGADASLEWHGANGWKRFGSNGGNSSLREHLDCAKPLRLRLRVAGLRHDQHPDASLTIKTRGTAGALVDSEFSPSTGPVSFEKPVGPHIVRSALTLPSKEQSSSLLKNPSLLSI